jgi:hypothetical protein
VTAVTPVTAVTLDVLGMRFAIGRLRVEGSQQSTSDFRAAQSRLDMREAEQDYLVVESFAE